MREQDDVTPPIGEADIVPLARVRRRRRGRELLGARAATIPARRRAPRLDAADVELLDELEIQRPRNRSECRGQARPCPWVSCKHHLFLDINPHTGGLKLNFPDRELEDLLDTCALDVAERGGSTLEDVAIRLNITRERVRQVEVSGLLKLRMISPSADEPGGALLTGKDRLEARAAFDDRPSPHVSDGRVAQARRVLEGDPDVSNREVRRLSGASLNTIALLRRELGIPRRRRSPPGGTP